jgi:Bacterial SH3 domain
MENRYIVMTKPICNNENLDFKAMKNNLPIGSMLIAVIIAISCLGARSTMSSTLAESIPNPPCSANDPTGTPLNLRSQPNGKIIARIKNNTIVEQTDTPIKGGKWQEIRVRVGAKQVVGWVFKAYLACQ